MKKVLSICAIVALVAFYGVSGRADDVPMKANDANTWNLPVQVSKIPTRDELAKLETDAGKGDAQAQSDLGILYYFGRGVPRDYTKAIGLWQKAAAQGDAQAENNLGEAYEAGSGVPRDYKEAASLLSH